MNNIEEIPGMVKRSIDNLYSAYYDAYYLDAIDIAEIIDIAWRASGYEITKEKFMEIVNKTLEIYY